MVGQGVEPSISQTVSNLTPHLLKDTEFPHQTCMCSVYPASLNLSFLLYGFCHRLFFPFTIASFKVMPIRAEGEGTIV